VTYSFFFFVIISSINYSFCFCPFCFAAHGHTQFSNVALTWWWESNHLIAFLGEEKISVYLYCKFCPADKKSNLFRHKFSAILFISVLCVCVCVWERVFILPEYDWIMDTLYGSVLRRWSVHLYTSYRKHFIQTALWAASPLQEDLVCAPCEKSNNRAPKPTPQPFRSAFICLLFAFLGLFRLRCVLLAYHWHQAFSLWLYYSHRLTVCTQISYNKGCYRRQCMLVWVIMPIVFR